MSQQDKTSGVLASEDRYVSRLTRETLALILAGGQGSRLYELTTWRAKPSLYFGGKYRIIDFPLSNCVNSGIKRIGVLTQYKAHSLIRHLVQGWSFFKPRLGEFMEILPASQRVGGEWYKGTADALYQNLDIIRTHNPDYVLILSGDHIYKQDYGTMIAAHLDSGAEGRRGVHQPAARDARAHALPEALVALLDARHGALLAEYRLSLLPQHWRLVDHAHAVGHQPVERAQDVACILEDV